MSGCASLNGLIHSVIRLNNNIHLTAFFCHNLYQYKSLRAEVGGDGNFLSAIICVIIKDAYTLDILAFKRSDALTLALVTDDVDVEIIES